MFRKTLKLKKKKTNREAKKIKVIFPTEKKKRRNIIDGDNSLVESIDTIEINEIGAAEQMKGAKIDIFG